MVCVRSLVPKEKKSAYSAIWSAQTAARGSSIIVPTITGRSLAAAQAVLQAAERDV